MAALFGFGVAIIILETIVRPQTVIERVSFIFAQGWVCDDSGWSLLKL